MRERSRREQAAIRARAQLDDDTDWSPADAFVYGGLDISVSKDGGTAVACLALVDAATMAPRAWLLQRVAIDVPYIPGFLGFREVAAFRALLDNSCLFPDAAGDATAPAPTDSGESLVVIVPAPGTPHSIDPAAAVAAALGGKHPRKGPRHTSRVVYMRHGRVESTDGDAAAGAEGGGEGALPEWLAAALTPPDIILVDGGGRLHPRECGSALHLGVVGGVRAIGVAKTFLRVGALERAAVLARAGEAGAGGSGGVLLLNVGAADGAGAGPEVWGAAVWTGTGGAPGRVQDPLWVSVGHRVALASAVALVQRCCGCGAGEEEAGWRGRLPVPIRHADLASRGYLRTVL